MTSEEKSKLLKAQKAELDAVILYKKLSQTVKNQELKESLLKISADEGKHAAILRGYTSKVLKPTNFKANLVNILYKTLGQDRTFKIMAKGELASIDSYKDLVPHFPRIQEIMNDEKKHAVILKAYMKH